LLSLFSSEAFIRLAAFAVALGLLMAGEVLAPRRRRIVSRRVRWTSNFGLVVLNTVAARLVLPLGAVGIAWATDKRGWGLFNNIDWPDWIEVPLAVLLLDFAIYLQHVMFHAVPLLWRLHMVHHADLDFDVSTGLRFHTLEILLSLGIKAAVIVLLGASALAVMLFEIALNATSMFNHSNLRLPLGLDRILRLLVVTPDMHRVHHSVHARETNSNFGFNFPWWDRLLGTYRPQPADGHEEMTVGLSHLREDHVCRLAWMLALPFVRHTGDYPINRRSGGEA
jgi:sterol desaturase/sphingolipid hydroxylase (fatty acid hydroxylase superfamily)